jgi:hypothetical protein
MHHTRRTILLALVALGVSAFGATVAEATTIRHGSATGSAYSGAVNAVLVSGTTAEFESGFVDVSCDTSSTGGSTGSNGQGSITSASWTDGGSGCSNNIGGTCTSTAQNLPWDSDAIDGSSDKMITTGMKVRVVCTDWFNSTTTCYYKGNNASGDGAGTLRGDLTAPSGGNHGRLSYPAAGDGSTNNLLKDTGSSFACSSTAKFTATYDMTGTVSGSTVDLWVTP